jgi:hydrogenase-4 component B
MTGPAWVLAAPAILGAGALVALACGRRSGWASAAAVAASILAAAVGLPSALVAALGGPGGAWSLPWSLPGATLALGLDALSGYFLAVILALSVPAAIYGRGYLAHRSPSSWSSAGWAFFLALEASMLLVVLARDGFLFLLAWEAMAVSSFFLVISDHAKPDVRRDGIVYLAWTHLGAAALVALFGLWGVSAEGFSFRAMAAAPLSPGAAWAVLLLALLGFGSKAGLVPFHPWLPRAHPAAPSHVSALMSGVMIKMGIYGLMRVVLLAGAPPAAWGYALLGVGTASALGGVLYALAQHDLKRLLAYHSVENVGIIALGLGAGLVARSWGMGEAATLATAGALLHVLNHGLFKGLLFYSGGAAAQAAGTRDIESLGGLLRRMPLTGAAFLAGSAAICALPPLNGFVSEWLIYLGLLKCGLQGPRPWTLALFAAIPALALVGGLALACFAKASGVAFLGEPRSKGAATAREVSLWMTAPMAAVALACAAVGLAAPWFLRLVGPAAGMLAGAPPSAASGGLPGLDSLRMAVAGGWGLLALSGALIGLRRALLRGRPTGEGPTWGCGYTEPTARMQYTASSFADPLLAPLARLMAPSVRKLRPKGLFPKASAYRSHVADPAERSLFDQAIRGVRFLSGALRPLQHGRLQIYLLYILLTLVALLVWMVWS